MNLFDLHFDTPWAFALLVLVPLLFLRTLRGRAGYGRLPLPSEALLEGVPRGWVAGIWWAPDALRIGALVLLILALARPQTEDRRIVTGEGVDIMVALDMSASMNAVDLSEERLEEVVTGGEIPNNRFDSAREILEDFVLSRQQDRLGLVVFGPEAWLKYPLTLDYGRLVQTLDGLILDRGIQDARTGSCINGCTIDGGGTAIGDALGRAYNRLRRSSAQSRIIVLITDGKREGGTLDPMAIARHVASLPADEQVRIYTFQVGSQEQTWLPATDFAGRPRVDEGGRPVYGRPQRPFPTDPELLKSIADMTGGKFYESYDQEKFREDMADLEKTVFKNRVHTTRSDVFGPFVVFALVLLMAETLLRVTRWRSLA
jgi:Ca-activated chloride channel family protein